MDLLAATLRLASDQHGWLRTSQVRDLGVAPSTFSAWCRAGRFVAGPRGLWRPASMTPTSRSTISLGVLATGTAAAATGRAALFLRGVIDHPPTTVRVVHAMGRAGARHLEGVHVRVVPSRTVRPRDVTLVRGIRTAVVARALVDRCHRPWPSVDDVRSDLIPALQRRRTTVDEVERQLEHCQHVPGTRILRLALTQVSDSGADSFFTHEVWTRLVAEGFPVDPAPVPSATAGRALHPDITLLDGRICIECDGAAHHSLDDALVIDNRKDRAYRAAGHEVLRIRWSEFTSGWNTFAADLRTAIRGQPR